MSSAVLDGIRAEIAASGGDVGELSEPPAEEFAGSRRDGAGRRGARRPNSRRRLSTD